MTNNIYIYTKTTFLHEYFFNEESFVYYNNHLFSIKIDKLNLMTELIENLRLDLDTSFSTLTIPVNFDHNTDSINLFLENKRPSDYQIDEYLLYSIVFNVDYRLTNTITNLLLSFNDDYFNTLQVFLSNNGNVLKSSRDLFMHRNTLIYRLKKIESILELDLSIHNNIHSLVYLTSLF